MNNINQKIIELWDELLSFKDDSDFHFYGFGRGGKYYLWMKKIQEIRQGNNTALFGDVVVVGLNFIKQKGYHSMYTKTIQKEIEELRKELK